MTLGVCINGSCSSESQTDYCDYGCDPDSGCIDPECFTHNDCNPGGAQDNSNNKYCSWRRTCEYCSIFDNATWDGIEDWNVYQANIIATGGDAIGDEDGDYTTCPATVCGDMYTYGYSNNIEACAMCDGGNAYDQHCPDNHYCDEDRRCWPCDSYWLYCDANGTSCSSLASACPLSDICGQCYGADSDNCTDDCDTCSDYEDCPCVDSDCSTNQFCNSNTGDCTSCLSIDNYSSGVSSADCQKCWNAGYEDDVAANDYCDSQGYNFNCSSHSECGDGNYCANDGLCWSCWNYDFSCDSYNGVCASGTGNNGCGSYSNYCDCDGSWTGYGSDDCSNKSPWNAYQNGYLDNSGYGTVSGSCPCAYPYKVFFSQNNLNNWYEMGAWWTQPYVCSQGTSWYCTEDGFYNAYAWQSNPTNEQVLCHNWEDFYNENGYFETTDMDYVNDGDGYDCSDNSDECAGFPW